MDDDELSSPPPSPDTADDAPGTTDGAPATAPDPPGAPAGAAPATAARRRRRRKILIRSLVALALIAGLGLVAGTYYYDHVALPDDINLQQATTIYYADAVTPLARIGDKNRTVVAIDQIPTDVQHAVVAAQDETFYTNDGVDYRKAAGAAWNHVAGERRQGSSTISQQYARQWAQLEGGSYSRKLREAVIATKLNSQYDKSKILEMYLNITYFGRGAYGIQAAAEAYFGKPAKDLSLAEGMVLAGLIDSPEGEAGKGSPFDPTVDAQRARERFDDIKGRLIKLKFVAPAEAEQKTAYPAKVLTAQETRANSITVRGSMDGPEGLIVHHVLSEVAALTDPRTGAPLFGDPTANATNDFDKVRNGGLKIVTTIDQTVQQIAVREAGRNAESNMNKQPENLQAALVAVEPGTGSVKAYYGGDSGNGNDYAGYYSDPVLGDGAESCCGGHPLGAAFNVYTLAAGLMAGYSTDSRWNGVSPQEFPPSGRTFRNNNPIVNAGESNVASPQCASGSATWCTLEEATVMSLNVPFFAIAEKAGPAVVIDTARAAGITAMWANADGTSRKVDLTKNAGRDVFPRYFQTEIGVGQYPVTVLDHAGGMATFAARGLAARTHFLKEVWTAGKKTYSEAIRPTRIPGFTEAMADDLNAVLQGVPKHYGLKMHDGRPVAGAAGAWPGGSGAGNAHAWMAGYSAYDPGNRSTGLAVAVWVGNKDRERKIVDKSGQDIIGGTLPGAIWRDFLDDALTALKTPRTDFPTKQGTGDKQVGTGIQPGR